MPLLRFRRWSYLTPLAPHVAVCATGRRYLWDGKHEGVTSVPYEADVEELLNPIGDQQSAYEVAWERYGVQFHPDRFVCESCNRQRQAGEEITREGDLQPFCDSCKQGAPSAPTDSKTIRPKK